MLDKLLLSLFSSALTLSGSAFVLWLVRNILLDALKGRIKLTYEKQLEATKAQFSSELEVLKADRARDNSLLALVHKTVTDSMSHAQQRKVEAIEGLWEAVLAIKSKTPPALVFLDCLLEPELPGFLRNGMPKHFSLPTRDEIDKLTQLDFNGLERHRLFSGEYLWSLYQAFMALHIRATLLLIREGGDQEDKPWYRDTANAGIVRSLMTESDFQRFSSLQTGQLQFVRSYIERKFLEHAARILNGAENSNEAMRLASTINREIERATMMRS